MGVELIMALLWLVFWLLSLCCVAENSISVVNSYTSTACYVVLVARKINKTGAIKYHSLDILHCLSNIKGVKKGVKKIAEFAAALDFKGIAGGEWWPQLDSNQRPIDYESSALTN